MGVSRDMAPIDLSTTLYKRVTQAERAKRPGDQGASVGIAIRDGGTRETSRYRPRGDYHWILDPAAAHLIREGMGLGATHGA